MYKRQVIGGAYFGDNLSMISDTTISAAKGVGSEMKDKFKMNFFIALPAAIFAAIMYGIMGGNGNITGEYNYHIIRVLPYIVVLITALIGFNVSGVLVLGIAMTCLLYTSELAKVFIVPKIYRFFGILESSLLKSLFSNSE